MYSGAVVAVVLGVALPGFSIEVPPRFVPDPTVASSDTVALAPVVGEGLPDRRLVAYFGDGTGADAASLTLSSADGPLGLEAGQRSLLASATAAHFRKELDVAFEIDHTANAGQGPSQRIEVWGTAQLPGEKRWVGVAYFPGLRQHVVAVASMPVARRDAMEPVFAGCFDSFFPAEPPDPWARSRTLISLVIWGSAGLTFVALRLWRRRRRA